jgi:AraC-like DNA-binding protein
MNVNAIQSCHLGPEISPEQFISEHFFLYLLKGSMKVYDGDAHYIIKPGEYYVARKNHLVRYTKHREDNAFQKIVVTLDEPFLQKFLERHPQTVTVTDNGASFFSLEESKLLKNYIQSLEPYYLGESALDEVFSNVKREELVLILLKSAPVLAGTLFNFGMPQKIDLEAFMHRNFRFNVSLERFAFMTGRSLSSFKRDFIRVFGTTPGIWLKKKRLDEAYFRISRQRQKPVDVYLEVGFEDLSHFSVAFKKEFGKSPSAFVR